MSLSVGGGRLGLPIRLARATLQARNFYKTEKIDLVVGTGGRTSVPAAVAARCLGVPLFLLEQNVVVGRANRLLTHLAERIYYGLPPQRLVRQGVLTGSPLAKGIGSVGRAEARHRLDLPIDSTVVFVTGGSQGAEVLNRCVPDALASFGRELHVLHLAGEGRDEGVRARYSSESITAFVSALEHDMADFYAAADLVICRGGGGTVAELMASGRASVIVPYPYHRDRQQWHNGRVLEAAGAARLCEEVEVARGGLADLVGPILADPKLRRDMESRAHSLAPDNACERIISDMTLVGALD